MGSLLKDIRYAFRILIKKDRVLTIVAILTLGLGIAAPVTWYSVLDKTVFKPLPLNDIDQFVVLNQRDAKTGRQIHAMSVGDFLDLRNESRVYESLSAFEPADLYLTGVSEPVKIEGARASANAFHMLGITPAMGRLFLPEEEQPGHAVVILSDRLWRQHFGSDPNILGRGIFVNDQEHVVIGVMPPAFEYPIPCRAWVPLTFTDKDATDRTGRYLQVIGRMKPGVSTDDAQAETTNLMRRIAERNPNTNQERSARIISLVLDVRSDIGVWFNGMCFALSLFVLGLCCVNITTIQLARGWARQKELTLRAAIGASRWKIMRQLLTESILLSLVGGIPALIISYVSVDFVKNHVPPDYAQAIPGWYQVSVDGRVLAFGLLITVLTGIIFGLVPALGASKIDLTQILKEHGGAGIKRHRVLKALIVAEVAVAIAVMAGAGSLLEGFVGLPNKYRGLYPDNVITMQISAMHWTDDKNRVADSLQRLMQEIKSLPGVQSASTVTSLPGSREGFGTRFMIKGGENTTSAPIRSEYRVVSPEFFETFNMHVLNGRLFGEEDRVDSRPVAVISDILAKQYFPGRDPIEQQIKIGTASSNEPWVTIVGVVPDIARYWFEKGPAPMLYLPYTQNPKRTTYITIRTTGDPTAIVGSVSNEVRKVDKNIAIDKVKSLSEVITEALSGVRIAADFSLGLVITSLLLALAGVYGMATFSVAQRTREFGVRMALGARQRDVRMMTMKSALKLAMIGVCIGLPLSLGLSITMASFLYGVGKFNVVTLAIQILMLVFIGLLGSYIPAKRASSIQPVQALRE
jgi:putative ABC transport system permease protein